MTTIAANTEMIVTDSQISDGDQTWAVDKVVRINGGLYATAGDAVDGERFYEWVRGGRRGRKPKLDEDGFNALVLNKSGLYWLDCKLHPMEMKLPFAIGSGGKAARAAMLAGADIVRAVEIVCSIDAGSALPVQIWHLDERKQ